MDSLSQLALGASVTLAVMGRRTAAWKAVAWGAAAGTLPDLDALVDHGDAIANMVLHRAESHSLLFLALLAWPMGWLAARVHNEAVWATRGAVALGLALVTHPLLDWMTVYGTQLWQPFTDEAYGLGSMFIIDPLYTLPLVAGVVWALVRPTQATGWGGLRLNRLALALSTAYLAWSALAQAWVGQHAVASLQAAGLPHDRVLVTPAPLNTVLWRVVAMDNGRYHEGFYSLLDAGRPVRFVAHADGAALKAQHAAHPQVARMARFTDGFYRLATDGQGHLWLTDLRMGQEPAYVFHFDLGLPPPPGQPVPVATQHSQRGDVRGGLRWLPLAGGWTNTRDLPAPQGGTFQQAWKARKGATR